MRVLPSENYTSSDVIVFNSLFICQHLIKYGFFVRGCINKVIAWCDGSNIIGPAYMDAFKGEDMLSFPAIIINDSAADDCKFSEMIAFYKDNRYINVFNSNYLKDLNFTIYKSITDIL